jgi:hypothetical protein
MRVLVRLAAWAFLLALASSAILRAEEAPDPARVDAALEMMQAIGVTKQLDNMVEIMITQFASSLLGVEESKKEEAKKTLDAFAGKFRDYRPDMLRDLAVLYARRFTVEELEAITAFYRSQPGMKFVAAAPELMRMGGDIGGRYGQKAMQEAKAAGPQP